MNRNRVRMFVIGLMLALVAPSILAQTANPRFARWKLKSANAASTNIMTYEAWNTTGMKVTVETTRAADGSKSSWGYTTMFDGKEYPVEGRNGTTHAIVRIVNDKINEIIYKDGDRVTQLLVNVLSADGRTIEVTYYAAGRDGSTRVTNATYEKMQ